MAPRVQPRALVLIVDPDAGICRLIGTALELAGFRTVAANDLDSAAALLATSKFAVIVRDLNLAPGMGRRNLQQLAATAPEMLRRTIVMTTAAAQAATAVGTGTVFAIVGKPFDVESLVNAVRACARGSRGAGRRAARRTASSRRRSEPETEASVKRDSLRRFAMSVPSLHHLLSGPVGGQREATLRAEMRRTLGVLAATLTKAAHVEASKTRAAAFRAASNVAGRLSTVPAPGAIGARGRDH